MSGENPLFSIVTPVYGPAVEDLELTIASVLAQTFVDWEWILVDDRSPHDDVREALSRAAAEDSRIVVVERPENGGISRASNDGVARARGEFLVLLDHDDLLVDIALETMAEAIRARPDVDYLYSDEDKVDANWRRYDTFLKPDWSPERLRHQMYTSHLSVLRTELVRSLGGYRSELDGSQDHDLVLRVGEVARAVVHVPEVLYHWRAVAGSAAHELGAKPLAWERGRRAVQEHLDRVGIVAEAGFGPHPGMYTVNRSVSPDTRISLIVPTRGDSGVVWGDTRRFVTECVRSALSRTQLQHVEVVVVYDVASLPTGMLEDLAEICGDRLVAVPFSEPFNFSAKCNLGFLHASGDIVVLLNDDIEAHTDGWLERLVAPLVEPDVGMTGAKLLFSNGTLQHGGHVYGSGSLSHVLLGSFDDPALEFGLLGMTREVSGVTAACAALRREVYEAVGGCCEQLPGNFNDVDLSRKVRHLGHRVLWVHDAALYHFESRTRIPVVQPWELDFITARWGEWGESVRDPFAPVA